MKKGLFFLLVFILILCGVTAFADAQEWTFDANMRKITGYNGAGGDVVVPDSLDGAAVRSLDYNVFNGRDDITSVTLPQTIQFIDSNNFFSMNQLTEITIPAQVAVIGSSCFSWCDNLQKITFEGPVPAFAGEVLGVHRADLVCYVPNDQLDAYAAALPDDVKVQPSGVNAPAVDWTPAESDFSFDAATGTLTAYWGDSLRVDVPAAVGGAAVQAIGEGAFAHQNLVYVTIPEGVTQIGPRAFEKDRNLEAIVLPDSLKTIGASAFDACAASCVWWGNGLEEIGDGAFKNAHLAAEQYLPASLRVIGDEAFAYAWVREAYLSGHIERIGSRAFYDSYLNYLCVDAYGMIEVGEEAFVKSRLEDVDLPWDSDQENQQAWQALIDSQIEGCKVWINNPADCATPTRGSDSYESYPDGTLYLSAYTGDQSNLVLWHSYDYVQVTGLGDGVFKGNQTLKTYRVTHNDNFKTIGAEAFADSAVETVDLYYTTETIGAGAFRNCINLKEITLPASLTTIGEGAFAGCENLEKVTVNCDPKLLKMSMFAGCKRLDVAEVLGLEKMPYAANAESDFEFDSKTGMITAYKGSAVDVVIPRTIGGVPVTGIGYNAFERARDYTDSGVATNQKEWLHLRSVVIPETVLHIDDSAFSYCQQLELVVCYAPLESTGRSTFYLCTGLQNVIFVNGVDEIDNYCFDSCRALENVYWGDHLRRIGISAFARSGLISVVVDAEIVDEQAFYASALWDVTLTDRVREVHNGAFGACDQLTYFSCTFSEADRFVDGGPTGGAPETGVTTTFPAETTDAQLKALNSKFNIWNGGHIGNGNTITLGSVTYDLPALPDVDALYNDVISQPVYVPEPPAPVALPDPISDIADVLGEWKLALMVSGGQEINPSLFGLEITLTLNADGTGALVSEDEDTLAWYTNQEGVLFIGSGAQDDLPVGYEDGCLVVLEDEDKMIFAREGSEALALPEPQPVEGGDAYVGSWRLDSMLLDGTEFKAADFGLEMALTLKDDGTAVMVSDDRQQMIWYVKDGIAYAGVGSDDDVALTLDENGCLTISEADGKMIFVRDAEGETAAPAPAPGAAVQDDDGLLMNVKYMAASFSSAGITMDAAYLGAEYSIVLHEDGSCEYIQAGAAFPDMTWKRTGDDSLMLDYMNGVYSYTLLMKDGKLDLDFGGMIITYEPSRIED